VTKPQEITPLLAPLAALQRLLARFDNQGIVVGGVAASLLGKPRLTADVDVVLLLSIEDLPLLMEAAAQEGLAPRITDAQDFAQFLEMPEVWDDIAPWLQQHGE